MSSRALPFQANGQSGILLVDKKAGSPSFRLVSLLRRRLNIQKIGHAGTLDPFATGVMVMLIGSEYTRKSNEFLLCDKQYKATFHLGISTDTYDIEGQIVSQSDKVPTLELVETALLAFQGTFLQTPPMFSAKKVGGKKLYELARLGQTIAREAVEVRVKIELLSYCYPYLELLIDCSKGTYIRSLAFDLGKALETGCHVAKLTRTKSGSFTLEECVPETSLEDPHYIPHLRK